MRDKTIYSMCEAEKGGKGSQVQEMVSAKEGCDSGKGIKEWSSHSFKLSGNGENFQLREKQKKLLFGV